MSPADGELGKVTVIAPPDVLTKKPSPFTAVKGEVFAVVHQSTVPVLPEDAACQLKSVPSDVNTVLAPPLVKIAVAALELP